MASYRRAAWNLCWWGCLFGVLQVAHGSERMNVPLPSVQDLLNRASPVLNENPLGYVQAHDSSFQYQQRSYSVPVQQKTILPNVAVKSAIKSTLKANAAAVAMNAAMAGSIAAVGWVIDTASQPVQLKKPSEAPASVSVNDYKWRGGFGNAVGPTPKAACDAAGDKWAAANGYTFMTSTTSYVADNAYDCRVSFMNSVNVQQSRDLSRLYREGDGCTKPSYYSSGYASCVTATYVALQDSDYSAMDNYIDTADSKLKHDLLNAACKGSLSPANCYKSLQDAASFLNSGPSSIQGPKVTSSTTNKNADGTVSNSTTTKDTKFDMKYDGTGATATPVTTTTTKDGKGGESTTTDKEDEDSSSGTAPKPDDEKETALPCTTNCDGPAYKDLYTKTDVTKEGVLDTYAAKVKALPIMSAVGNFFTVNGGGSCPVWSGTIDIGWGQSVTLSNDFACQPWFTALSPAFHAVLMLVAAWLAFRVSILD